ncbi:hypothetical protein PPSIR1_17550 [Plesiocystis pacifica SIR-1]|uniref:Uncharacterized protein n=1 Tax=Plesiocystis pacifica SIR-1 TaxID=391625 RepID=A6GIV1_9BACT|nr:hypothetical protein [Plesiocystis pacifica]EDM74186.1 hypothetical protein PPSIR1_17550 [Plesiocystis pacifica SIR-1]
MKLRIRADSLRLRLTQGEVRQLAERGRVDAACRFGPRALEYALAVGAIDQPCARFEGDRVEVLLPAAMAQAWATSEQVGIEHEQALPEAGASLRLLIEKDFQCLAPRAGEEDSDAFPHPGAAEGASC